jgi:hypothetical protein
MMQFLPVESQRNEFPFYRFQILGPSKLCDKNQGGKKAEGKRQKGAEGRKVRFPGCLAAACPTPGVT